MVLGLASGIRSFRQSNVSETEPREAISWVDWGLLLVLAIAISARAGSWAWSLTQTSVANSNLLHNMTPVFATIGGWLFLKHSFDRKFILGLFLAISGVVAIGVQDFSLTNDSFYGDVAALMSSVFYAINFLIIEKLRSKMSTTAIMTWSCVFVSLLLLPGILITGDSILPIFCFCVGGYFVFRDSQSGLGSRHSSLCPRSDEIGPCLALFAIRTDHHSTVSLGDFWGRA